VRALPPRPHLQLALSFSFRSSYRLFHGNLVIDNEVPSKLLDLCPLKNEREFKFMRYTAATCDPNNFKAEVRSRSSLRPRFSPASFNMSFLQRVIRFARRCTNLRARRSSSSS